MSSPRQTPFNDPALLTHEDILALEQAHARRRLLQRWASVVIGVALIVGAGFGALPALHAVKAWQARRLAAQARQFIDKDQWLEAKKVLSDANAIWKNEPEAVRATAIFLERVGNFRQSLTYWELLERLCPLTTDDQRDYAATEFNLGNLDAATLRLRRAWPDGAAGTAADWLLGLQIALRQEHPPEAAALARRLLASPLTNDRTRLTAATALLATDNSPEAHQLAWQAIEGVAAGNKSPESLDALLSLARWSASLSPEQAARENAPPLPGLIARIDAHPLAKVPQHLLALDLRAAADPARRPALIQEAIDRFGATKDDAGLGVLTAWLYSKGEFDKVLAILPPERAVGDRTLFLQRLDTLGALGRWTDIRAAIQDRKFPLDPVYAQMYLARCADQLGEPAVREACWDAAFSAAGTDAKKLLAVGQYAEKNGVLPLAGKALRAAVAAAPDAREANDALFSLLQMTGQTRELRDALVAFSTHAPEDRALRNDIVYLGALLDTDVPAARDTARQLVAAEPYSLPHRTALALAEMRLDNGLAAMDVFRGITLPGPAAMLPSQRAVYAAVLWKNSYEREARDAARNIPVERLLPEERTLIQPILESPAP